MSSLVGETEGGGGGESSTRPLPTRPPPPAWYQPEAPPLTPAEATEAVGALVRHYPAVVRDQRDPVLSDQKFGTMTFQFFESPKVLSNGVKVWGLGKLRGNHPTDGAAERDLKRIICEVDSRSQNRIAEVGAWFPLTNDPSMCKEVLDVDPDGEEGISLRGEAVREQKQTSERIMRQIKERAEEVKNSDPYDDVFSLDFYTTKMQTYRALGEAIRRQERKLDRARAARAKAVYHLRQLETVHPEYKEEWVGRLNAKRAESGLHPDRIAPWEMEEYDAYHPGEMLPPDPDELRAGYNLAREATDSFGDRGT